MDITDLPQIIQGLGRLNHIEKIKAFAWYLHTYQKKERITPTDVRGCYGQLHFSPPEKISNSFIDLTKKKPPVFLRDQRGYRLESRVREAFDVKYGNRPLTVAVEAMLAELPGKVPNEAERLFLAEAIRCFRVKAFRAAIVMTWNVAYDHFEEWIIRNHLTAFNAQIGLNFQSKRNISITKKEDFSTYFKEHDVIEIAKSAGIIHDNIKKVMSEKLARRNLAAHPSLLEITQFQAEDAISDLVNNVILKLT